MAVGESQFQELMLAHMQKQTDFLREIRDGFKAVRVIIKFISWVAGVLAAGAAAITHMSRP